MARSAKPVRLQLLSPTGRPAGHPLLSWSGWKAKDRCRSDLEDQSARWVLANRYRPSDLADHSVLKVLANQYRPSNLADHSVLRALANRYHPSALVAQKAPSD